MRWARGVSPQTHKLATQILSQEYQCVVNITHRHRKLYIPVPIELLLQSELRFLHSTAHGRIFPLPHSNHKSQKEAETDRQRKLQ